MVSLLPLVVLLAACRTCGMRPMAYQYSSMRVVGGSAARHGNWPWIVSIQNYHSAGTGHMCGGPSSPAWVSAAAHCFRTSQSRAGVDMSPSPRGRKGGEKESWDKNGQM
uniref:Peptidase S1 domain-containing protein n=1 Tax=Coturnix japonica TaxID=93934 RepID=A0A8C2T5V8_COTJA